MTIGLPCVFDFWCSAISWMLLAVLLVLLVLLIITIAKVRRKQKQRYQIRPPSKKP